MPNQDGVGHGQNPAKVSNPGGGRTGFSSRSYFFQALGLSKTWKLLTNRSSWLRCRNSGASWLAAIGTAFHRTADTTSTRNPACSKMPHISEYLIRLV